MGDESGSVPAIFSNYSIGSEVLDKSGHCGLFINGLHSSQDSTGSKANFYDSWSLHNSYRPQIQPNNNPPSSLSPENLTLEKLQNEALLAIFTLFQEGYSPEKVHIVSHSMGAIGAFHILELSAKAYLKCTDIFFQQSVSDKLRKTPSYNQWNLNEGGAKYDKVDKNTQDEEQDIQYEKVMDKFMDFLAKLQHFTFQAPLVNIEKYTLYKGKPLYQTFLHGIVHVVSFIDKLAKCCNYNIQCLSNAPLWPYLISDGIRDHNLITSFNQLDEAAKGKVREKNITFTHDELDNVTHIQGTAKLCHAIKQDNSAIENPNSTCNVRLIKIPRIRHNFPDIDIATSFARSRLNLQPSKTIITIKDLALQFQGLDEICKQIKQMNDALDVAYFFKEVGLEQILQNINNLINHLRQGQKFTGTPIYSHNKEKWNENLEDLTTSLANSLKDLCPHYGDAKELSGAIQDCQKTLHHVQKALNEKSQHAFSM